MADDKLTSIMTEVREKKERRNAYMNLAWTGPVDNSRLQEHIAYEKVVNVAIDMFCNTSAGTASGDGGLASSGAEAADGNALEKPQVPKESLQETLKQRAERPWNIPLAVERGFEIPVCISAPFAVPELGKFQRLGMDVVVNAVWLAYFWAKEEGNQKALSALRNLILDWPMDFILVEGSSADELEENIFLWAVNASAKVERLREFVGLGNSNLMRIVARAADIVENKMVSGKKAKAVSVHKWLVDNVRWGVFQVPDVATVERHLHNWAAIDKNGRVQELMESANQRWGRNNLLDWPTKLQIIVSKTDPISLTYVVEWLYQLMWRKNAPDPYGAAELKRIVPEILWQRQYVKGLTKMYPDVLKATDASGASLSSQLGLAKRFAVSPLAFFMQTEGPDRDPTWLQALPTEAARLFMKHVQDLNQMFYAPEVKGALASVAAEKYSVDKFLKGGRVSQRFSTQFAIAYDSLHGSRGASEQGKDAMVPDGAAVDADESLIAASASAQKEEGQAEKKKHESKDTLLASFRKECEEHCQRELEARVVSIVAGGTHTEIIASVTATRLYQNMTEEAPCMAFYDVKNARLCNVYEGEGAVIQ